MKIRKVICHFVVILFLNDLPACSLYQKNQIRYDLSQNQKKWQVQKITHYRYTLHNVCFCPNEIAGPVVIEVKEGKKVSMKYPEDSSLSTDHNLLNQYETFDKLFALIQSSLDDHEGEIVVKYDTTYGYPRQISIDPILEAKDDQISIYVDGFQIVK